MKQPVTQANAKWRVARAYQEFEVMESLVMNLQEIFSWREHKLGEERVEGDNKKKLEVR